MKMLKKIFAFVLLFSIVFSSIGISTYAKESSALTEVVDSSITSPEEDGKRVFTLKGSDLEDNDIKAKVVVKGQTERLADVENSITFSEDEKLCLIDTPAFTQCLNETLQMEEGKAKEGLGNGGILDIRDECLVLVDQFDTNKFVYQLTDKDNTGIINLVGAEDFTNLNEVKGEDTKIFICVDQSHLKELNYMFPKDWWTIGHKKEDVSRRFVFAPQNTRFKKEVSKDGTNLIFIYTVNYGG